MWGRGGGVNSRLVLVSSCCTKILNQTSNTRGPSHDGNFQLLMCLCRGIITLPQTRRRITVDRRNMARLRTTKATLSFTDGVSCHRGWVPDFVQGNVQPYYFLDAAAKSVAPAAFIC